MGRTKPSLSTPALGSEEQCDDELGERHCSVLLSPLMTMHWEGLWVSVCPHVWGPGLPQGWAGGPSPPRRPTGAPKCGLLIYL